MSPAHTERNRHVVEMATTPGHSQADVAREFGISRERVRQILEAAGVAVPDHRGASYAYWVRRIADAVLADETIDTWGAASRATLHAGAWAANFLREHAPRTFDTCDRLMRDRRALRAAARQAALRDAIVAALRDATARRGSRPPTHDLVAYRAAGLPSLLAWNHVRHHFGSYRALCDAAGIPYDRPRATKAAGTSTPTEG